MIELLRGILRLSEGRETPPQEKRSPIGEEMSPADSVLAERQSITGETLAAPRVSENGPFTTNVKGPLRHADVRSSV